MRKNGFTLIELLVVIVILAIIVLIATPLIMNVIDDSKKGAFKNTAYGIIKAAELSYTSDTLSGNKRLLIFTYNDGIETSNVDGKKLEYKGQKPRNGIVKINEKGEISLYIHNGKYCIEKKYDDIEVTISEKSAAECTDPRYNFSKQKVLEGYIPIANANELYNIRDNASNVFGLGTE